MAIYVFKDASLTVNSQDLSDHVRSVTLRITGDVQDATAHGATYKAKRIGLGDWNIEVEWNQDFAASEVDATLSALLLADPFAVVLKPTSGAVSATNPSYSGNMVLASYTPITGNVGVLAIANTTFEGAGTLTRNTS